MFPSPIFTSNCSEWPLQEYEEKRILNALSQQQHVEEEEEFLSPTSSTSSTFSFTDKTPFQLTNKARRQSLSNSLRCPLCQRRFHSQGNLSNHTELYH